jgi:hypothetical protein
MIRAILTLLTVTIISYFAHCQTCDCKTNFEWVKQTFEQNDAGFQYAADKKGKEAYSDHNKTFLARATAEKDPGKCMQLLYEWLTFFRPGHIAIRPIVNNNGNISSSMPAAGSGAANTKTSGSVSGKGGASHPFPNWETVNEDLPKFEKYLQHKKEPDYEGIWETPPYKVGIKKYGNEYKGFIIESGADTWTSGQIKLRITTDSGIERSVFYLRDHSLQTGDVTMIGKNHLQLGNFSLARFNSQWADEKDMAAYFRAAGAQRPFLEELNKTTLLLRIPSFRPEAKKDIDSVVNANWAKIHATENLILDMTSGTGGSDESFEKLLPILYTNPIRTVGVEYYSTPLNNQRMLDFINKPEYGIDEEGKKWARNSYDTLSRHIGQFINLGPSVVSVEKYDTVYPYPKNIAILINERNGSTDEQFLLAAKQSRKVKLFGATTFGELDFSNMYFVPSPCHEFELGYCLTRSLRIPGMAIDGRGIQPDYFLDKSIPRYQWIQFASDVLNEK